MKVQQIRRLSLVALALVLCVALGVALLAPTVADAYNTGSTYGTKKISEIFKDNETTGGAFDKTNLESLLDALGASGATLDNKVSNLQSIVYGNNTTRGNKTYNHTKQIASSDIIVRFGGIDWIAVFLSTADTTLTNDNGGAGGSNYYNSADRKQGNTPNNQDVVLTLWQATANTDKAQWNLYGTSSTNTNGSYPANMYGTSLIRATTLNNGGSYAESLNATSLKAVSQDDTNMYAKFNMDHYKKDGKEYKSNIRDFLVAPRYVEWQKNLKLPSDWGWGNAGGSYNNEGWGYQGESAFYLYNGVRYWYESKNNYAQWMDDLIWLPASAETGNYWSSKEQTGLWATNAQQRSSTEPAWLRTAVYHYFYGSYDLTADGALSWVATSESHLVRPALHLNLTSAAKAANTVEKPSISNKTVVYNGQAQTVDLGISTADVNQQKVKIEITTDNGVSVAATDNGGKQVLNATQAGTYNIKISLFDDYRWENNSNLNDTSVITATLKIEKRKVSLDVKLPDGTSATLPYGTSFNLSSGSVGDYWSYVSGTSDATDSTYTAGTNYKFVNGDQNKLVVNTPTANQQSGAFRTPAKYPVYVEVDSSYKADIEKNYVLTFSGNFSSSGAADGWSDYYGKAATITVEKAKLIVTANDNTVYYGEQAASNGVTYSGGTYSTNNGFAEGESEVNLAGELKFTFSNYTAGADVNTYANVIAPSGLTSSNYDITFKSGSLTVQAKPITLNIANATHKYGASVFGKYDVEDPAGGWVNEGDKEKLMLAIEELFKLQKQNSSEQVELSSTLDAGRYDIIVENGTYGNYDVTFNKGVYQVTKAVLTVTANDATISYGDEPSNTGVSFSGFVNDENEEVLTGAAIFEYGTYRKGSPVGTYTISVKDGSFSAKNYTVEYETGELTVEAKKIELTINNATHRYGAKEFGEFSFGDPESGWVKSSDKDALKSALEGKFKLYHKDGDVEETLRSSLPVGTYDIKVADGIYGNYNVTFTKGEYEVTKGLVTLTANDAEISYGETPNNTGVTGEGFADGEGLKDLIGSLVYDFGGYKASASEGYSDIGTYTITISGYTSDNYDIEYRTGTLTVNPKVITLTIKSATHVYGEEPQDLRIEAGEGFVKAEDQKLLVEIKLILKKQGSDEQVTLSSALEVGTYDITAESKTYGNYSVIVGNGVYTVTSAKIKPSQEGVYTMPADFYNYEQGTSNILKHEIKVNASDYKTANNQPLSFTYTNLYKDGVIANTDWTVENGIFSVWKVGVYTVTVRVSAPNHDDFEQTVSFTILSTELTVTLLGQTIVKPFGEEVGNVNDLVFGNVTVFASGFAGNVEALKSVFIFSINDQTTVGLLNQGYYTLALKVASGEGFTLRDGSDRFENMVRISQARINVDNIEWERVATYTIGSNGSPATYQLKIDESLIKTVGNVKVSVVYGDITATTSLEYCTKDESTGVYTVYKAGTYYVTVTISAPNHDDYVGTLRLTIKKATANVYPTFDRQAEIWTSGTLPEISAVAYVNGHLVEGRIMWTTSLGSIKATDYADINWQWVANDSDDIEIATGSEQLFIRFAAVSSVTIVFNPGDRVFYDTDPITDLKNFLTVTVAFTDGTERQLGLNEYELTCKGGTTLVVGENVTINVSYLSGGSMLTQSFTVTVLEGEKQPEPVEKQVSGISIKFAPDGRTFLDTDDINELKNYLTVIVEYTDGSSITLGMRDYTLTCQGGTTLIAGKDIRVTVTFLDGDTPISQSFSLDVEHKYNDPIEPQDKLVERVEVEFNPNGRTFYDTDDINELKNYLTVTVIFNDGTNKVLKLNEYSLTCHNGTTLVAGKGVRVVVTFLYTDNYVSQSFTMDVEVTPVIDPSEPSMPAGKQISKIEVSVDLKGRTFYDTDDINELKNYLTVTVTYDNGATRILAMNEYELSCQNGTTLVAGDNVRIAVSFQSSGIYVSKSFTMNIAEDTNKPADKPSNPNNPDNPEDSNKPNDKPTDPNTPSKDPVTIGSLIQKVRDWCQNTPMPLGYASIALGVMLLLIIILAIAARKPKKK